jgi:cobalt-zinc-cadmium efflux system membrane fusion protein
MIHFTFLRKRTRFLLLLSSFLFLSACGSKQTPTEVTPTGNDIPPSISGQQAEPGLVKLTPQEVNELKIKVLPVSGNVSNYQISVPGMVFPSPNHVSIISTPINGRISRITVHEGQAVRKGQELFSIESLEFGNMVSEYLQAVSEEKYQTSRLQRLEQLVEQTISSKNELDRTQSDYQRATTAAIAAKAKLKAIGVPDHEIEAYKVSEQIDPTLKIHSPISGVLDQRTVELGQAVNALETLARVLDNNQVLIRGYVSPDDSRFIHEGDSVKITQRQGDQLVIPAIIGSINPGIDETNRSVVINILATTQAGWPKPGENVRLDISTSTAGQVIAIPLEALTYDGNDAIVFVQKNESTYEKRVVQVSGFRDKYALAKTGLAPGERLAISQIFSLKALSRYDRISEE